MVRPLARLAFLLVLLVTGVVMVALAPLGRLVMGRVRGSFEKETSAVRLLRMRVGRLWVEQSPEHAAAHAHEVLDRFLASPDGLELAPYGRFEGAFCADELAGLAYQYDFASGRFAEALAIAEAMHRRDERPLLPTWIVSQARCLLRLDRTGEAKELLLANRDLYDPDSEINQLLDELKRAS